VTNPIGADPTDEEMAAIMVAVEFAWPRSAPAGPPPEDTTSRWRFSGRWWARLPADRRDRPRLR
jgi:hypothetical protein